MLAPYLSRMSSPEHNVRGAAARCTASETHDRRLLSLRNYAA